MEFKRVYEDLKTLLPLSTDVKVMQTQREQSVMSFLTGLRPEFEAIRSQILNESTIPSLHETFAKILRHADLQSPQTPPLNSALVSRGGFRGNFRGGYRGSNRGTSRGGRNNRAPDSHLQNLDDFECYYCHELGHTKCTCKKLLAKNQHNPSANFASTSENSSAELSPSLLTNMLVLQHP